MSNPTSITGASSSTPPLSSAARSQNVSTEELKKIRAVKQQVDLEKQKFEEANRQYTLLQQKNQKVQQLCSDPQYIANCAYNEAERQGLKGNVVQIALEASKQVNAFSINPNLYRNTDTFKVAQGGKKQNQHIVNRIREIIPQVLKENSETLQRAAQQVQEQKQKMEAVEAAYLKERQNLNLAESEVSEMKDSQVTQNTNLPNNPDQNIETWDDQRVKLWVQEMYINNENKAKGAKDLKFEIAKGIAQDLSGLAGYEKMDEGWFHQIYSSMDKSDKRWFNDACGEIHKILFNSTTDAYAYQEKGPMKTWRTVNKPFKKVLSWLDKHNSGDRFTLSGQVNSNGEGFVGPSTNPQLFKVFGKNVPPTPAGLSSFPAKDVPSIVPMQDDQVLSTEDAPLVEGSQENAASSHSKPPAKAGPKRQHEDSQENPSKETPPKKVKIDSLPPDQDSHTDNLALKNVKDGLSLLDKGQKQLTGYSGLGKAATAVDFAKEIDENGVAAGTWNGVVNLAAKQGIGKVPGLGIATTLSSLYANNVPKEAVEKEAAELRSFANEFDGKDLAQKIVQNDLREAAVNLEVSDFFTRGVSTAVNYFKDKFKVHPKEKKDE